MNRLASDDSLEPAPDAPRPVLSVFDAVMITVGIVIGAGIFKAPSLVAGMAGSTGWMLGAWLLGGVISLIGALCYAELGSSFPNAGGEYFFLRTAYGDALAFLFAWARMPISRSQGGIRVMSAPSIHTAPDCA